MTRKRHANWHFRVCDPVRFFGPSGATLSGHVAKKTFKHALVVANGEREFRLPWGKLAHDRSGTRRRVFLRADACKAKLLPDDEVRYEHRGQTTRGVIARFGRKNALVVADDGSERWVCLTALELVCPDPGRRGEVRLKRIARKAEALMEKHGLRDWSFQFDDAIRRAACCDSATKVISLAHHFYAKAPAYELRDTILHEIAHAMVGNAHGHDRVWKQAARSIGCNGERCHNINFAPPRYIVFCRNCRWKHTGNTRKRRPCRRCGRPVSYKTYTRRAWTGRIR